MSRLALLFMSCEGQTRKIIDRIGFCLEQSGHSVIIASIDELADDFSLESYDGVILGCSIRYGRHHKAFVEFIHEHQEALTKMPGYFFSTNLTARKPERSQPFNNRYLQKFLKRIPWTPDRVEVFAGALLYTRYGFLDKVMIQLIMKITGGPTDTRQDTEFTDWKRVRDFAAQVDQDFQALVTDAA